MAIEDFVIVGTAGHIDHGKTTLVRALTGVETDRTREEQERGISIDIGFAPFVLPSGRRMGLVDVPGHERFIRNMLAGAGGIDLILLVIDAREGVMPQTREHLAILQMLGVQNGVVVLTKIDVVDAEWLSYVQEEVRQELAESFLAAAPIVAVSSVTGQGLDLLKEVIEAQLPSVARKPRQGALRLPIDRVFSVQGFGTVVTGTIWRGTVRVGDTLELLPSRERARVRSVQVHGETVEQAQAGQRAAVALSGIRQTAHRGMTLGATDTYQPTRLADVQIQLLSDVTMTLAHRQRVRIYSGTAELFGRVLLLDEAELKAGESGLAQLLLEQDAVFEARDHFVLRTYSPMHTLGGGAIIDAHPSRLHRRHKVTVLEHLRRAQSGTLEERLLETLVQNPLQAPAALATVLNATSTEIEAALRTLVEEGALLPPESFGLYLPAVVVQSWQQGAMEAARAYLQKNRFDLWISRSVVIQGIKSLGASAKLAEAVLETLVQAGELVSQSDRVRLSGYEIALTPAERQLRTDLYEQFRALPMDPPTVSELETRYPGRDRVMKNMLRVLEQEELIVAVGPDQYMSLEAVREAQEKVRHLYEANGPFSVAQVRDELHTSRKWAVAFLEYLDRLKRTKRTGDVREYIELRQQADARSGGVSG
ncbi:MAG: selenocysteine-specific translation elongation factor [Firmicutes bacterium]|nr:selenocysteine-specific translation elongation factor [Bacillota bacterium]